MWKLMILFTKFFVVCRDLKPENILLDDNGKFSNQISGFNILQSSHTMN